MSQIGPNHWDADVEAKITYTKKKHPVLYSLQCSSIEPTNISRKSGHIRAAAMA